jgi:hypothetical protein
MLRVDCSQWQYLTEIIGNIYARIAEAKDRRWPGEARVAHQSGRSKDQAPCPRQASSIDLGPLYHTAPDTLMRHASEAVRRIGGCALD